MPRWSGSMGRTTRRPLGQFKLRGTENVETVVAQWCGQVPAIRQPQCAKTSEIKRFEPLNHRESGPNWE